MLSFHEYIELGLKHILDLNGYDHILFILSIISSYKFRDWPLLLGLVSAFTIGHSVTLALATLKIISFDSQLIETLIPITIIISALINLRSPNNEDFHSFHFFRFFQSIKFRYLIILTFGFIHGMGFSNFLRSILGRNESIFLPLLGFNLGLEIGQVILILFIFGTKGIIFKLLQITGSKPIDWDWNLFLSGGVFFSATALLLAKIFS